MADFIPVSIVSTTIAPTASQVAQSSPQTSQGRSDAGSVANNVAAGAQTVGNAASASVSSEGKTRSASSGEKRAVDGSFETEDLKSQQRKQGGAGQDGVGEALNVTA